ncbi:EamA family transporter RarD [Propionimicrobium sp. PCR01-08-3]|uniref:EamA family transporter RarD n=1 Tax=Propionimicrobium sp. PCR01-08-3 TaxID=3052086 RepID=UPI00255C4CA2|nr:EamA family transporter RarD [Propionimicrobium sp. PCR01-08-3]WIY81815.1 EamA family transporter RarD [Propionimicrobium sp. PCR01-08-3]
MGRNGVSLGFAAYFLWGLFPLYFKLLSRSGAFEVVAYRIVCCLVFCVLAIAVLRGWRQIGDVLHNRRAVVVLAGAGLLVSFNWTMYVWGVNNGHALDASLGYFINPLVNAVLGVVLLGEKMRTAQWVAFAISAVAVVVLVVGYGSVPWVALGLASTFATYGLMKKKVGAGVPALPGLAIETSAATPFALGYLVYLGVVGANTVHLEWYAVLVALAGPVTAIPLLLFASASAKVPLSTMGILQYVCPIMQFLTAWLIFAEQMPPARWLGFAIIWVAVVIFIVDALVHSRQMTVQQADAEAELVAG